jgi:hypothetical protein
MHVYMYTSKRRVRGVREACKRRARGVHMHVYVYTRRTRRRAPDNMCVCMYAYYRRARGVLRDVQEAYKSS